MVRRVMSGWGNYPKVPCEVRGVDSGTHLASRFDPQGTIARGRGRSYADQAVVDQGAVLSLGGMDRFTDFDATTGVLSCEAGTTLADIIQNFAPRGWFPMITPGTKHVTVGGCIANDVHGKGHHADGCFSRSVLDFDIVLADGQSVRCSPEHNADLFWATCGGLGLTGVITRVTLQLRRIETTYFRQQAIVVDNLVSLLEAFERTRDRQYSVAWIDPLATGAKLGRGVLTVGDHASKADLLDTLASNPLVLAPAGKLGVPFHLPNYSLNQLTLRALNRVIGAMQAGAGSTARYDKFFYPLDAVSNWNRGYGTRGFTQYQFVVPLRDGESCLRPILECIAGSGFKPFLNVLKKFGPEGRGHLSFPFEGYTLAIDFPISRDLSGLMQRLDAMVIEAGGRVYLGKDAFLHGDSLRAMYPRLDEWLSIKRRVDPNEVFRSHLSARVGLTH